MRNSRDIPAFIPTHTRLSPGPYSSGVPIMSPIPSRRPRGTGGKSSVIRAPVDGGGAINWPSAVLIAVLLPPSASEVRAATANVTHQTRRTREQLRRQ